MKKTDLKRGKEIVNRIAEKTTLRLFRVGCEEKNFHILQKLPLTAREIEKELGLSAMPTNRRIKELMEVGLIQREKRGEKIVQTGLTKDFINYIDEIKKEVVCDMARMI